MNTMIDDTHNTDEQGLNTIPEKKIIVQDKYPLSELTGKIIGCAMEVHRILGNGFQEVIYQRALAKEMEYQGLEFSREHEMLIFYKGDHMDETCGFFRRRKGNGGVKSHCPVGRCTFSSGNQLFGSIWA